MRGDVAGNVMAAVGGLVVVGLLGWAAVNAVRWAYKKATG